MRPIYLLLICTLGWASLAAAETPPGASPFDLVGVGETGSVLPIQGWELDGVVYVSANDISKLLGIRYYWWSELGKLTLVFGRREVWVLEGSDIAVVDADQRLHLSGPAFLWEGRMMLPMSLLTDDAGAARPWVGLPLRFRKGTRRLSVGDTETPTLTEIRIASDPLGHRLLLNASGKLRHDVVRSEASSFVLRLDNVEFDPLMFTVPSEHPRFPGLRLRMIPRGVEVSFAPGPGTVGYRIRTSDTQNGIEVLLGEDERDLREGTLKPFAVSGPELARRVRILALDPGHGEDREGKLAMDLCWRVAARIRERFDLEVIMTREGSEDPTPETRSQRANSARADLLLSVHLPVRDDGPAAFVAQTPAGEAPPPSELRWLGFRTFFTVQEPHLPTSRLLARSLVESISDRMDQPALGVFEEALGELQAAAMPAVLLEIGVPEGRVRDSRLNALADGILEGLRLFLVLGEDWR